MLSRRRKSCGRKKQHSCQSEAVGTHPRTRFLVPHGLHPCARGYHIVTAAAQSPFGEIKGAPNLVGGPVSQSEAATRATSSQTESAVDRASRPTGRNSHW